MENREQQILSEIKVMVASIRTQLQQLDSKMMELQMAVDPNNLQAKPVDIDMDDMDMIAMPLTAAVQDDLPFVDIPDEIEIAEVAEPVELVETEPAGEAEAVVEAEQEVESVEEVVDAPVEETVADDLPAVEPVIEPAVEPVIEPVAEPVEPVAEPVEPVAELVVEPTSEPTVELVAEPKAEQEPEPAPAAPSVEEDDDDMPLFAEPQPLFEAALNSPKAKKAVIDVMTDKQAWRTDLAGSPVRDLLSAISLNDRVHFIKTLFRDDAVLFQQTRAKINGMSSLDEVVDYVTANFDWDMSSQTVYRFMMAVRRKVQA